MKRIWISILVVMSITCSIKVQAVDVSMSSEETKLYNLIMEYRAENNLPSIPISPALTYVAQAHVRDLQNYPRQEGCNMHSWSDHGNWTAVCYTSNPSDEAKKAVWNKPREMTTYQGAGYEISYWNSAGSTARSAIKGWKTSPGHNATMINLNNWSHCTWRAIGIGIYKDYAVVWFGEEEDSESPASPTPVSKAPAAEDPDQASASQLKAQNAELEQRLKEMDQRLQTLQNEQQQTAKQLASDKRDAQIAQLNREIEEQKAEIERLKKVKEKNEVTQQKEKPAKEKKVKEPKPKKDPSESWLNKYYDYSGFCSLSYLSVGYMYSCVDGRHIVNASLLDFRASLFGASLLNVEMAVSPFNKRFAYRPSIRIYVPIAKCLSIVPYGGAEIDASYLGRYFDKSYLYDETQDFYINAVGGVAINLTAARHVPMEIKVEYRHPLLERMNGAVSPKGIYVGAQIYFGSVFEKR